jgi:hypothetical protein
METEQYIEIVEFCRSHEIEQSFLLELNEAGLVHITQADERQLLAFNELPRLERILRLHLELNINIEGIDAIQHLVKKVSALTRENRMLKNRLNAIEGNDTA